LNPPDFTWNYDSLETRLYIQKPANEYPCSFEIHLFNTAKHQNTQTTEVCHAFYLIRLPCPEAIASISLVEVSEKHFASPAKAPFGGIQCHPGCKTQELIFFLSCMEKWMQQNNAKFVLIKTAPVCYDPVLNRILHRIYLMNAYQPIAQVTHHIEITNRDFFLRIKKSEYRRLNKCKQACFKVNLEKTSSDRDIFKFISNSFSSKNYKLSIPEEKFEVLAKTFSDEFLVFTAKDGHQLIAVCVTVRVSKNVLYLFIPTDLLSYRKFSPMVLLYERIYNYCQKEGIKTMDLGTSTDHDGKIKPGLVCFKENMGGVKSLKISYQKVFD
jgi:hypothetical protein